MKTQKYKTTGNRGLFDEQDTYEKLSAIGNPLERITLVIDFEMFRKRIRDDEELDNISLKKLLDMYEKYVPARFRY